MDTLKKQKTHSVERPVLECHVGIDSHDFIRIYTYTHTHIHTYIFMHNKKKVNEYIKKKKNYSFWAPIGIDSLDLVRHDEALMRCLLHTYIHAK